MAMITLPITSLCTIASTLTHHTGGWYGVCSINNKYYAGAVIYIRAVNIQRDAEQYGTYYQAVRSYREQGIGEARGYPSRAAQYSRRGVESMGARDRSVGGDQTETGEETTSEVGQIKGTDVSVTVSVIVSG
jgi:hypothetical protein